VGTVQRISVSHHDKFCGDRSKRHSGKYTVQSTTHHHSQTVCLGNSLRVMVRGWRYMGGRVSH